MPEKSGVSVEIVCLDLEGVLVPEIWINFAELTGIEELRATTRDVPDYDQLMRFRLGVLEQHKLGIRDIEQVISDLRPLEGAVEFLDALRRDRSEEHTSELQSRGHLVC